ncbi:MAG: cold-shock protein [Bacteroidetes bacterium GWA2_30_7]|nr:MAG: cold-shock protein [Bacteroidetes bacterium GWA2_30_7]
MARSNNSFIKKQKADKKSKIRKEKLQKKVVKTKSSTSNDIDSMIAYVDEFGNITNEPPEQINNKK